MPILKLSWISKRLNLDSCVIVYRICNRMAPYLCNTLSYSSGQVYVIMMNFYGFAKFINHLVPSSSVYATCSRYALIFMELGWETCHPI